MLWTSAGAGVPWTGARYVLQVTIYVTPSSGSGLHPPDVVPVTVLGLEFA